MRDTIFALSSAPGRAGIAVVRVSGPKAVEIYCALTRRTLPEARVALLVRLFDISDDEACFINVIEGGVQANLLVRLSLGPELFTQAIGIVFN